MAIILFMLFYWHPQLDAQVGRIDSLKNDLKNAVRYKNDSLNFAALKQLMRVYSDRNIDSSSYYNALLVALCQKDGLRKELSYAYQYTGYLFQVRGDYHQSIRYYYKALSVAEKHGQYKQIAGAHRGLAHAYSSLKEYPKAKKHCIEGLQALKKEADPYTQLGILNVQGAIFREQNQLNKAKKINEAMYLLASRQHENWYEAQGLHALGWVHKERMEFKAAMSYFDRAIIIAKAIRSVDLECSILLNYADLYMKARKWQIAKQYCVLANRKAKKINNSSIMAESEEKLYQIFKITGKFSHALQAHENFVLLRDSLAKEKTDHRIENLQAQYDNVKKTNDLQNEKVMRMAQQNENQRLALTRNGLFVGIFSVLLVAILLFGNNRQLHAKNFKIEEQSMLLESARMQLTDANRSLESRVEQRTAELLAANKELFRKNQEIKEALFKGQKIERKRVAVELHDNLSSLLSAVNMSMQSINPDNLSELEQLVYKNVKQMVKTAYTEVRNISHNILPADLEKEGLVSTISNVLTKINQSNGLKVSLFTTELHERLPVEIEFNLYSIIFELINNSIKHSKAKNLEIFLSRTSFGVELSVTDDGIGFIPRDAARGMGLQNIQTRLGSLGGTFEVNAPKREGTQILIKIPIESVNVNGNMII